MVVRRETKENMPANSSFQKLEKNPDFPVKWEQMMRSWWGTNNATLQSFTKDRGADCSSKQLTDIALPNEGRRDKVS